MTPPIKGFSTFDVPCFSFLIEHPPTGRRLVFDLGIRQDWETGLSPTAVRMVKSLSSSLEAHHERGVREILEQHGVPGSSIEAVVWSHWHFDHTGDPSTFDPHTALLVGPGFKDALLPGYPADPDAPILEADYAGRELRELRFGGDAPGAAKVGRFDALDYFGDGSFYLLDSPGHTVGHLCGLARVTSGGGGGSGEGDSFIFLGGDASHHPGEFRPSPGVPLPDEITPHPLEVAAVAAATVCPGALFEHLLRGGGDHEGGDEQAATRGGGGGDRTRPFFGLSRPGINFDPVATEETIRKMQEADAQDGRVLVVIAHDKSLLDVVDFFPKYANDFASRDWVKKGRWAFLRDFKEALG